MRSVHRYLPFVFVAMSFVLSVLVYSRLPLQMPVHFDIHGVPNGSASRAMGAFRAPAIALALAILFEASSRRKDLKARGALLAGSAIVSGFVLIIHAVVLAFAMAPTFSVGRSIAFAAAGLHVLLGLVMPKLTQNRWMGIRTRKTLSDADLWAKTHLFAGYAFFATGLLILACALVDKDHAVLVTAVLGIGAALGSAIYSEAIARRSRTT